MSRLKVKNMIATGIFIVLSVVAASFIALLLGVRIPVVSTITEMLGLPTPQ